MSTFLDQTDVAAASGTSCLAFASMTARAVNAAVSATQAFLLTKNGEKKLIKGTSNE